MKANTGLIAAHGYKRPFGSGQTASCRGALFSKFEANRDRLGSFLTDLRNEEARDVATIAEVEAEPPSSIASRTDPGRPVGMVG
ncbi:hypothetical protein AAFG13_37810 [Bradyrhizobium sp. B124]|uniref:hypothetical protein n=1 Tax=Bradyrhizobium sp. B124 TaxID=3140245 RepID=UPI0031835A2B